jgi:hypothetical protein
MSQPFFEEVEIDSMMSKNSCAEHTSRRQLQQQVCNTHRWGVPDLSGVGFFREVFIMIKRFEKRAILLLG